MNSCLESFCHGMRVKPLRHIDEYANDCIYLKQGVKVDLSRVPYMKEILRALSFDSPTRMVVILKGVQLTVTTNALIWICQLIEEDPCNIIYVMPTGDGAENVSKFKFTPIVESSPTLKEIIKDTSIRDGKNTILSKSYPGGTLWFVGGNSSSAARSKDARIIIVDEFSELKAELKAQGSHLKTYKGRQASYGDQAKMLVFSTPVEDSEDKTNPEFLLGTQEHYHVPCPYCKVKQVLVWENLIYENDDPSTVKLKCQNQECGKMIEEKHKTWMMAEENGACWIAKNPNCKDKKRRSFKIPSYYSPVGFLSWAEMASDWIEAKEDQSKQKTFTLLYKAETWKESEQEETQIEELLDRRYNFNVKISDYIKETYPEKFKDGRLIDERCIIPKEVLLLTSGWDTQDNWIEGYVIGWGLNDQWWVIDHQRFDPPEGRNVDHLKIWDELEIWRKKTYIHENGTEMHIHRICHDTGGHYADQVYNYVRGKYDQGVYATKGSSTPGAPLISAPSKSNNGRIPLRFLGTDTAKRTIYGKLRAKKRTENGYLHLPDWLTDESCRQFLSEKLKLVRVKNKKGDFENIKTYQKIRKRNEGIDCLVGAYCAMKSIRPFINWVSLNELYNTVENQENTTNDSEMIENNSSLNENIENSVDEENNIDNGEQSDETEKEIYRQPQRQNAYQPPQRKFGGSGWFSKRRR